MEETLRKQFENGGLLTVEDITQSDKTPKELGWPKFMIQEEFFVKNFNVFNVCTVAKNFFEGNGFLQVATGSGNDEWNLCFSKTIKGKLFDCIVVVITVGGGVNIFSLKEKENKI